LDPVHVWDKEIDHNCSVQLRWIPKGRVVLDDDGKLRFPKVNSVAGLYRMRTRHAENRAALYVGESDNLSRRFGNYRNPGPTQQTSLRINRFLSDLLAAGGEVSVSLAAEAKLGIGATAQIVDFADKPVRRLFENLAIVLEQATEIENLNR
jgi:hypothetical protein